MLQHCIALQRLLGASAQANIAECVFSDNQAARGAAIAMQGSSQVRLNAAASAGQPYPFCAATAGHN
jgi:predicted outer membrane repeat protein